MDSGIILRRYTIKMLSNLDEKFFGFEGVPMPQSSATVRESVFVAGLGSCPLARTSA